MNALYVFISYICLVYGFEDDGFIDGKLTLIVEDNLTDDFTFAMRSSIYIPSITSGNPIVTHTREWKNQADLLRKLVKNDDFYQMRILQKGAESNGYIYTFTRACLMFESELTETLSVMLDGSGSSVVGLGLFTPVSVCTGRDSRPVAFNTTVIARASVQAPVPDTATFIQKIEAMKHQKAEGKDNRSFFAKYWMYIIPVVLFLMISGGSQEGGR